MDAVQKLALEVVELGMLLEVVEDWEGDADSSEDYETVREMLIVAQHSYEQAIGAGHLSALDVLLEIGPWWLLGRRTGCGCCGSTALYTFDSGEVECMDCDRVQR